MLRAIRHHTDCPWVLLYIERWLKAPVKMEDGSVVPRTAGTPQGGVISPLLANLFLHYAFDAWMARTFAHIRFERYADGGAGSRLRKYTVGTYGRVTLPMARAQAQKIFAARLDGRDPAEEKKQGRRRLVVDQVEGLVETFIRERLSKVRTVRTQSNRLRRDLLPYWGTKSVHD